MERTPLIDRLWAEGVLDADRQRALDVLVDGPMAGLPPCLAVTFDPEAYALTVGPLFWPVPPRTIALPRPEGQMVSGMDVGLPSVALFGPDLRKVGEFTLDDTVGVLVVAFQVYRYAASFRQSPFLAWGRTARRNLTGARAQGYGPVDLTVNRAGDAALVLDRAMGTMHHVDLNQGEVRGTFKLRPVGGTSSLNAAWIGNRVFVTDGQTAGVTVCDLGSGETWQAPTELGVVGNVLPTPDNTSLFLLSVHPQFAVRIVDADTFEPKGTMPLKGEPFSRIGDPHDIFAISPDARHMLVMAYVDDPQPHTPVVNVFEVETGKNIHRYRLNPTRKPAGLAFGVENPFYVAPISVESALVQLGYLTEADLAVVKGHLALPLDLGYRANDLMAMPISATPPPSGLEALAGGTGWRNKRIESAPYATFPLDAEALIADYLHKQFQDRAKMDVRAYPGPWTRLLETANRVRTELEWFTAADVHLTDLAAGYDLHCFITREQLEEWLHVMDRDDVLNGLVIDAVVPENCPECRTPMLGAMTCRACGWQVGVNGRSLADPRRLSRATINPLSFLPPGHLLLADPERQRLVELDKKGAIFWQLQGDTLHAELRDLLKWPIDGLRLANGNTIILDMLTGRVFEVTKGGRPHWEWPQSVAPLQEPLRVARTEWGENFVVDRRSHCIWQINTHGDLMEGYGSGVPGIGLGELSGPTDLQVLSDGAMLITDGGNHRVIEVNDGQIVWQFGNPAGFGGGAGAGDGDGYLESPRRAIRLESGETLILDTGNHRLLIVDRAGTVAWQHDTFNADGGSKIERPIGMLRLPEGRIVYWDLQRLVEISLDQRVIWTTSLDRLDTNPRLRPEMPEAETAAEAQPRRLFHVARLADDDPEMTAIQAATLERRKQAAGARQAWEAGDVDAYVSLLKAASEQRLAAAASAAPNVLRTVDVEAVRDRLRREAQSRLAANQHPATGANSVPAATVGPIADAPPSAAETAAPELKPEDAGPDREATADDSPVDSLAETTPAADERLQPGSAGDRFVAGTSVGLRGTTGDAKAILAARGETAHPAEPMAPVQTDAAAAAADTIPPAGDAPAPVDRLIAAHARSAGNEAEHGGTLDRTHLDDLGLDRPPLDLLTVQRARGQISLFGRDRTIRWQWGVGVLERPQGAELTPIGNVLVADTHNNRVLEVEMTTDDIVWSCGEGGALSFPRAAKRLMNGNTLIADAGNRRVVEVAPAGEVVWEWGSWSQLNTPTYVDRLADGRTLITDWGSHVVLMVSAAGELVWTYGQPRRSGTGTGYLHYPEQAVGLENGNVLIVDGRNNRVLEIDAVGQIRWQFTGEGFHRLTGPTWAERQADGATVILHGAGRGALEIDPDGHILWRALVAPAAGA
ncbi:MAG: hypothetical protein H7338_06005 [Candidatus Sericytochromatia bacterium]|nr:hypothetical protein [Candidatus Sericytochromatia bacterium]